MARGQLIKDDVKALIAKIHVDNPDYPAHKIQKEVHAHFQAINPRISSKWPSLSAVQKVLASLRSIPPDIKDSAWSLYTLATVDIPADALPAVLKAYGLTVKWELKEPLTVREAKWVARLYKVITNIEELTIAARECASNERVGELLGSLRPGLVDGDFISRAMTGKPGASYKYLGDGKVQISFRHSDDWEIDIQ